MSSFDYWKELVEDYLEVVEENEDYVLLDSDIGVIVDRLLNNDFLWDYIYGEIYDTILRYISDVRGD